MNTYVITVSIIIFLLILEEDFQMVWYNSHMISRHFNKIIFTD